MQRLLSVFQSYFVRRLLFFAPTLLAVCLLTFGLSQCAAGDPVELYIESDTAQMDAKSAFSTEAYKNVAAKLGMDKPIFYLTIDAQAYPDTLYRFFFKKTTQNRRANHFEVRQLAKNCALF